jgi:lipopolysaccharide biosynthesis regulator YciM
MQPPLPGVAEQPASGRDYRQSSLDIISKLLENSPLYLCNKCGFSSMHRQWQCPGCRQWESVKVVTGYVPGHENPVIPG